MQRPGVCEIEAVWHFFGAWLIRYYNACLALVEEERREDPDAFTDVEHLYECVINFKRKRNKSLEIRTLISGRSLNEFLREEAGVCRADSTQHSVQSKS